MGSLSAVLFDLDGLLIDSEPIWSIAEEEIMAWLGGPWDLEVKAACLGKRIDVSCAELVRIAGSDVLPGVVQEKLLNRMCELFRERLPWHDGARELLDQLHGAGVPLGLVSSSFRVLVDAALDTIGRERFVITIAGDEVRHAKPDPEAYAAAVHDLAVEPHRVVVFEDSPAGVASAEAAGCWCVAVPDVVALEATPTRPLMTSLRDVEIDWLLALPDRLAAA